MYYCELFLSTKYTVPHKVILQNQHRHRNVQDKYGREHLISSYLMFTDCRAYNEPHTTYYMNATHF